MSAAQERRGLEAARRLEQRLRKRAGRAASDAEAVNSELTDAVDVFAAGNWGDLTVEEIARAGGRIERLGRQLVAAERLPYARQSVSMREARLRRAEGETRAEAMRTASERRADAIPLAALDVGEVPGAPGVTVLLRSDAGRLYELTVFGAADANEAVLAAEDHLEERHRIDAGMEDWWPA